MRTGWCVALLWALLVPAASSRAAEAKPQPDAQQEAAAHFGQGLEHFRAGDMPQALVEFEAAYALAPRYEALFNIAVAHRKLGHYAAAYNAFLRYLSEGGAQLSQERRQQIEEELAELNRFVAHVTVTVDGPAADVELDGKVVGTSPAVPALHVDAGRHELRAVRSNRADAVQVVYPRAGETLAVALHPPAPKPTQPTHVRLTVTTEPPGADLEVDEEPVGKAPWTGELKHGWHLVHADLDGYLPQTAHLDLQGESRTFAMELKEKRWYHRWYVWTAVAVVVAGGATTAAVLATQH